MVQKKIIKQHLQLFSQPKYILRNFHYPYGTSIYAAELLAIRAALQYISKFSIKTSIIFTRYDTSDENKVIRIAKCDAFSGVCESIQ